MSDKPTTPEPDPKLIKEPTTDPNNPPKPTHSILPNNPPLQTLASHLPSILTKTNHHEMWGVTLGDPSTHAPTANILIKFLRANEGNVSLAEEQLTKALEWRREMNPLRLVEGRYDRGKFGGLGFEAVYRTEPDDTGKGREIVTTWNIYGSVEKVEETFRDVDEFIRWRVALMELAIQDLHLDKATTVMPYNADPNNGSQEEYDDPYQMIQIHDYQNVQFFRMNPTIRAATRKTIEIFSMAYPELLREKFFVNVPAIMGWMFTAMKVFLSRNTTRKFHPITNGVNLAREFPGAVGEAFPRVYGGKAGGLEESARRVLFDDEDGMGVKEDLEFTVD